MDSIRWKSFSQSSFKSLESGDPEVPMPDESEINQTTESEVSQEIIESAFGDESSSTPPPPPNGFDLSITSNSATPGYYIDPTTGKLVKDETKIPFPAPTIEEIEELQLKAKLDLKIADWDRITEMYKMKLDEYTQDKTMILEIISKGAIPMDQLVVYKQLVDLADKAIEKINKALIYIPVKIEELEEIYKSEMEAFKKAMDPYSNEYNTGTWPERSKIVEKVSLACFQNLDDWAGEPGVGLRFVKNTTKGTVLYYGENQKYLSLVASDGTPVSDTWFDPSKEWLLSNRGLRLSTITQGQEDVSLVIDGPEKFEEGNNFGSKQDLGIPEFVIVERDSDGEIKEKDPDKNDQEIRLVPKEFEERKLGELDKYQIVQSMTDKDGKTVDMKKYAQVRIASVKIVTDMDHTKATKIDGVEKVGYDHIVQCFTTDDRIAIEFRLTNELDNDTAASDYQLAIHNDRELPVEVDASLLVQTCSGKMTGSEFTSIMSDYDIQNTSEADGTMQADGIKGNKLCDDVTTEKSETATAAFNENFSRFVEGGAGTYEQGLSQTDTWALDDTYGTTCKKASGLFSKGLIGTIKGCGNDFIAYGDPSETQSWRAREGKDETCNPFYSNIFFGASGASYEVCLATNGDFYGTNVTSLVKQSDKPRGITGVTMKTTFGSKLKAGLEDETEIDKQIILNREPDNIKNFLFVLGGEEIAVKNPSDTNLNGTGTFSTDSNPEPKNQMPIVNAGDDFYFTNGRGKFSCPNKGADKNEALDFDVDGTEFASIDNSVVDDAALKLFTALTDFEDSVLDPELLPDINELGFDYYSDVEGVNSGFFTAISQSLGIQNEQLDQYAAENSQEPEVPGSQGVDEGFNK